MLQLLLVHTVQVQLLAQVCQLVMHPLHAGASVRLKVCAHVIQTLQLLPLAALKLVLQLRWKLRAAILNAGAAEVLNLHLHSTDHNKKKVLVDVCCTKHINMADGRERVGIYRAWSCPRLPCLTARQTCRTAVALPAGISVHAAFLHAYMTFLHSSHKPSTCTTSCSAPSMVLIAMQGMLMPKTG